MKQYKLYLDDERVPADTYHYSIKDSIYLEEDWVIVRTFDDFKKHIEENSLPYLVSFDHDLADEHYVDFIKGKGQPLDYESYKEKTGFECAKFLVNHCIDNELVFPAWKVHSFNFIGKRNIESYIRSYLKSTKK